jgi:bla regulator protein blaR1
MPAWNHLWQSTVFAVAAGLLTLVLKNNRARTRYWLWLAASLKFLVPFALLISMGSHIEWRKGREAATLFLMDQARPPLAVAPAVTPQRAVGTPASTRSVEAVLFSIWLCGSIAVLIFYRSRWRRIRLAKQQSLPLELPGPMKVMSSAVLLEPAVFGILRPVLLLPPSITQRLTPEQLRAIFAHELCHVQYRDNLAAALHMLVEAIFWFHPLVWWLGARLVEERERACDEAVVQSGYAPEVYAEGILEVCKLYLASPVACAAGVSGANLNQRIQSILTARVGGKLSRGKKLLLAAAGTLALAAPLVVGLANAPLKMEQSRQSYKVVSIKRAIRSGSGRPIDKGSSREFVMNTPLSNLIGAVYHLHAFQVSGGPSWINSTRFDITANAEDVSPPEQMMSFRRDLLRTVLKDCFRLQFHREMKEFPVYILTVAESGLKLRRSKDRNISAKMGLNMFLNHTLDATGISVPQMPGDKVGLTSILSDILVRLGTDEAVIDKTGLTGLFDFHLEWNSAPSSDPDRPSLFTAVQEQLGLKLTPGKAPVEVLVVDHAEDPTQNHSDRHRAS